MKKFLVILSFLMLISCSSEINTHELEYVMSFIHQDLKRIDISPDDSHVYSGSKYGGIGIWNLNNKSGRIFKNVAVFWDPRRYDFITNNFLIRRYQKATQLVDLQSWSIVSSINEELELMKVSTDGNVVVTISKKNIRINEILKDVDESFKLREVSKIRNFLKEDIRALEINPETNSIFLLSNKKIYAVDYLTGRKIWKKRHVPIDHQVHDITILGEHLYYATNGSLLVYNAKNGKIIEKRQDRNIPNILNDKYYMYCSGKLGERIIRSLDDDSFFMRLDLDNDLNIGCLMTQDGKYLLAPTYDDKIHVYKLLPIKRE